MRRWWPRALGLRTRIGLLSAAVAAVSVVTMSWVALWAANVQAVNAVDAALSQRADEIAVNWRVAERAPRVAQWVAQRRFYPEDVLIQIIDDKAVIVYHSHHQLPVGKHDLDVAVGKKNEAYYSAEHEGVPLRFYTVADKQLGTSLTVAKPLDEVVETTANLRNAMLALGGAGVLGAGLLGFAVAGSAIRPVRRLTAATTRVAETQDLTEVIEPQGPGELAELAASFNSMLAALAQSRLQQRQLVADASHELRTPVTSLRTNIELLLRTETASADRDGGASPDGGSSRADPGRPADAVLTAEQRAQLLADVAAELDQLTTLVDEMVALATDDHDFGPTQRVNLAELVEEVAQRFSRLADVNIVTRLEPCDVEVVPLLVQRAVSNLIDNAVKWSSATPPQEPAGDTPAAATPTVTVTVRDGAVTVADEGPGIAAADRPHVFERFYRAADARSMPGSGLGLSIVARVAEMFSGSAEVLPSSPDAAGASVRLTFPTANNQQPASS